MHRKDTRVFFGRKKKEKKSGEKLWAVVNERSTGGFCSLRSYKKPLSY